MQTARAASGGERLRAPQVRRNFHSVEKPEEARQQAAAKQKRQATENNAPIPGTSLIFGAQLRTFLELFTIPVGAGFRRNLPACGAPAGAREAIRRVMHEETENGMAEQQTAARRRTIVLHGRLAMREAVLEAARERAHGLQALAFEQVAARLAGGLLRAIDDETLRAAIQEALPGTQLGEFEKIKELPGFVGAATDTLRKCWRADIDLEERAEQNSRLASLARLEKAILAGLPAAFLRPPDLVAKAMQRLEYAAALFGPVEVRGITELSPCWRPLLLAIAEHTPVRWHAGPRSVPAWLQGSAVEIRTAEPERPVVSRESAATPYHEALEAMRWARRLLASGKAEPGEIAIAAASTAEYDDHFRVLRGDAGLDLHFSHGVRAASSREGQAAAPLADILLRGLGQTRMHRLSALLGPMPGSFGALPRGWSRILPADAPLSNPEAWEQLIGRLAPADWPEGRDGGPGLRDIVSLLARGLDDAGAIGESLLSGRALAIWRKALLAGPAASLDRTLEALKLEDRTDPFSAILWAPAAVLAASPRKHVRLLGLNSSRWPRGITEDRLSRNTSCRARNWIPCPSARRTGGISGRSWRRRNGRCPCPGRGATARAAC